MSAIPQRPTHVVRRRGLTLCLLLTAALTTGAAMARADALVADITAISSDEARALARTSAAHLGVEEELPIVQESFRLGPLGSHYVVASADRVHIFFVNAHTAEVVRYENSSLLDMRPGDIIIIGGPTVFSHTIVYTGPLSEGTDAINAIWASYSDSMVRYGKLSEYDGWGSPDWYMIRRLDCLEH